MVEREIIEILKKYVSLLQTEGISIEKSFLYGSYSFGKATDESDIDLMIVTDDKNADDDFIVGKIWQLTKKINTKIEPFIVGRNRFDEDDYSSLIAMVKRTGIRIS